MARIVGAAKNMGRGMVERYGDRPGRSIHEPAFTLRASAGGTEPGGFVWKLDDGTTRKMTVEEASILQTYISPDARKVSPMHNTLKALDLFAGTGWGVACQRLGIDEMGVEIMPEAVATREANGMHTIYNDVWDGLTGPKLSYDLLIASPPCQTFSMAGHGAGRAALDEVIEAIEAHAYKDPQALRDFGDKHDPRTALVLTPLAHVWRDRPRLVAFEQVTAVLPVWDACAEIMRGLGYDVKVAVLQAEQYGVPQTRKRAILVARLDGEAQLPAPTHSRYYSNEPARLDPGVLPWVSMADALAGRGLVDRPSPTITGGGTETGGAEPIAKYHARYTSALGWVGSTERLTVDEVATLQTYPPGTVFRNGNQAHAAKRTLDQPAPTIMFGARSNKVEWMPADTAADPSASGVRVTIEEASALQSYERPFEWQGAKTKQYLQIGNAVPPLLAQAILTELTTPAVMPVAEPTLLDMVAA